MQFRLNFIFLLFFYITVPVFGQSNSLAPEKPINKYILDHWTTTEGLPANALINILQTSDGYIWISSYNGLLRFDGINFMVFNKQNTSVFKSNPVSVLYETKRKELLVSSDNDGLISYFRGNFTKLVSNEQIKAPIQSLAEDADENIWIGTQSKGLWFYDPKNKNLKQLHLHPELDKATVNTIKIAKNGDIWIGLEKGLLLKQGQSVKFYDAKSTKFYNSIIVNICETKDGKIWFGTGAGAMYYDGKEFVNIAETENFPIRSIVEDDAGSIWIATQKGLFRINGLDKKIEFIDEKNSLLPHPDIRNMMLDHEQSLWLTTYRVGLLRFKNGTFVKYTMKDGLVSPVANHICEWEQGTYLVGTDLGIINRISNGKVDIFPLKTVFPNDKRIKHLLKDSKGNLWISTYSGLLKREPDGKETLYTPKEGLSNIQVRLTFEDSEGTIWIGTRGGGLMTFKNGVFTTYTKKTGFPSDFIMSFEENSAGDIIVGTNESGVVIMGKDGIIKKNYNTTNGLTNSLVFNTYQDKYGILWITSNNGFTRLDLKSGKSTVYAAKEGLQDENIFDIKEDDANNMWLTSGKGIIKIAKKYLNEFALKSPNSSDNTSDNTPNNSLKSSLSFVLYDKHDGMGNSECTAATAALKTSDGSLYFPTLGGVVSVNVKDIVTNSMKPPVYTEVVMVDYEKFLPDSVIEIAAGKQRFSIDYTALSYIAPTKINFKYKLENFDKDWIDARGERKAVYTNLAPGSYTFRVIASNNDGIWNENGAKLKIVMLPYFWQTWWFWTLFVIVTATMVAIFYRWKVAGIKQRNEELEKLVMQRTSEIQSKSDEITEKSNQLLLTNTELKQQKEEVLAQQELVAESSAKLQVAFSDIQHKNNNITSSIQYAKRIQEAILPSESYIKQYLPNFFAFFKPRDIVSGDFYWFAPIINEETQQVEKLVVVAADCTGHGVPGAFMAMAGNAYLNQIINLQGYTNPSEILQWLHKSIRIALKQGDGENHDGMDIALCTIDLQKQVILYAGAQNPLVIIRQNADNSHELQEIKGTKIPIGGSWGKDNEERNFELQTIVLDTRPTFCYIFTDGFQDQFGGQDNKKFSKKRLYATFETMHGLPFVEQKNILQETLFSWQTKDNQVDDILVLGFQVK